MGRVSSLCYFDGIGELGYGITYESPFSKHRGTTTRNQTKEWIQLQKHLNFSTEFEGEKKLPIRFPVHHRFQSLKDIQYWLRFLPLATTTDEALGQNPVIQYDWMIYYTD